MQLEMGVTIKNYRQIEKPTDRKVPSQDHWHLKIEPSLLVILYLGHILSLFSRFPYYRGPSKRNSSSPDWRVDRYSDCQLLCRSMVIIVVLNQK